MYKQKVPFAVLISITLAYASVPSFNHEKRAACNADNCLNALDNHPAPAIPYCSAYTTTKQTATTGFPTYIPQTCGSSRVSSACSCLASQVSAAMPCPTGQLIQNPSFYGYPNPFSLLPWVITHKSGAPGCIYNTGTYSDAVMDEISGDPCSILCDFKGSAGTDVVSQNITLCPGVTYSLRAKVACKHNYDPKDNGYYGVIGTQFKILFNGQVVLPTQFSCHACDPQNPDSDCQRQYNYDNVAAYYFPVYATIVGPVTGKGTLSFEISAPQSNTKLLAMLLDSIAMYDVNTIVQGSGWYYGPGWYLPPGCC